MVSYDISTRLVCAEQCSSDRSPGAKTMPIVEDVTLAASSAED